MASLDNPVMEAKVGTMLATGMRPSEVATNLSIPDHVVQPLKNRPGTQEVIQKVRDALRQTTVEELAQSQTDALQWVRETIAKRDAKEFGDVTKGVAAIERTAASAAGELRPQVAVAVQANITPEQNRAELAELIRAFTRNG